MRALRHSGLATARRLELGGLLGRWAPADDTGGAAADGAATRRAGANGAGAAALAADVAASPDAALAFYRRGDVWTIGIPGRQIQLRDAKGLSHIARLLAAPQVELHALDLVVGVSSAERGRPGAAALTIDAGWRSGRVEHVTNLVQNCW